MARTRQPFSVAMENGRPRMTWYDSKGKRRRTNMAKGLTLTQARRQAPALYARLVREGDAQPIDRTTLTLDGWLVRYFALKRDLEKKTQREIRRSADRLLDALGDRRLAQYARADFAEWRMAMEAEGLSPATIAKHLRHVRGIFNAAVEHEYLERCVVRAPTPPKTPKGYVSLDQLDAILAACPDDSWRLLFGLARLAGLRANEILALRWEHVDLDRRVLLVRPVRESTRKSIRDVPIVPRLHEMLVAARHLDHPTAGVDPEKMYRRAEDPSVHAILERAGVMDYGKPLHTLRGSCENDWMEQHAAKDVCAWIGHSAVVAMEHYNRPTPQAMARATGAVEDKDARIAELEAELAKLRG